MSDDIGTDLLLRLLASSEGECKAEYRVYCVDVCVCLCVLYEKGLFKELYMNKYIKIYSGVCVFHLS